MVSTMEEVAIEYLTQYYTENELPELDRRVNEVRKMIKQTGTYVHTRGELAYGAKLAWRNSNRCIGRLFWERLNILDERSLNTEQGVAQALFRHIEYATNKGKVIPTITVFKQGSRIRIWNHQLIRYAGYQHGEYVVGDPASIELTQICEQLGWQGAGTDFDLLPLVISIDGKEPIWFKIPDDLMMEVELRHPKYAAFELLQLKWYAVPIISDMRMEIGGLTYYSAPFNGWYMGTEIGARNLADEYRYNRLEQVADVLGIETKKESFLWRDEALVELNKAVLHSFQSANVSIVDHHTAAKQFQQFIKAEEKQGRKTTGDWTWLIPPMSPAQTRIFHQSFENEWQSPNFYYEKAPYEVD
ncbi:nitric oxide synthase oxygenase [Shouchella patagoniensis]|uniref:nitric oxide synthase oxygenase n=1 Tax=Shouchella patagoniensis TaxID=228576 RepID=UPI0009957E4D|nr:nitric oxide synthase oxygenase [Shouchella patagoniensis]